jgi:lipoprotein NlpD
MRALHATRERSGLPMNRQESNLLRSRFDKTMMASFAGVWVAVAMSGCVNVAQQGPQAGVAAAGVPAASAAVPVSATFDAAASAASLQASTAAVAAAAAVAKAKNSPPLVYRVRRGDTLSHIAQHHHCSVKDLLAWNQLRPSTHLKRGQVLHVASPETVKEANAAAAAAVAAQAAAARTAAAAKSAAAAVRPRRRPRLHQLPLPSPPHPVRQKRVKWTPKWRVTPNA